MKRILVTGSQGHIGKKLCKKLKDLGHQIIRLDIVQLYEDDYIMCGVTNLADAYKKIEDFRPQIIFNLAAAVSRVTSEQSPFNAFFVNVCGVVNMVQLAIKYDAKLINFSTSQIYGDLDYNDDFSEMETYKPNNIYGLSKWMGQKVTKYYQNQIPIINIRPNMIYDPNQKMKDNRSALIRFVKAAILGEPIIVHKNSFRGWLHIDDAIELIVATMDLEKSVSLNIGNSDLRSVQELARLIIRQVNNDRESEIIIKPIPNKISLCKKPNLTKQIELLKYTPKIVLQDGIKEVVCSAKKRMFNG